MPGKDYYTILGIPREADSRAIQEAFRGLAKQHHPDHAGPAGTRSFQDLQEAYSTLSDPGRRAAYDRTLRGAWPLASRRAEPLRSEPLHRRPQSEPLIPEPLRRRPRPEPLIPEPASLFDDFETFRPSFEELRERWLRNFTDIGAPKGERVAALNLEIVLSPDEAKRGGELPLGIPVYEPCRFCLGVGRLWVADCPACAGQGVVGREIVGRIPVPAGVRDGSIFEVPVHGLGIRNFHLRLHIRVSRGC